MKRIHVFVSIGFLAGIGLFAHTAGLGRIPRTELDASQSTVTIGCHAR